MRVDGACHCGQISFTAEVDPAKVVLCHCTDCQILSGSPYRVVVPARIESFVLKGQPKYYEKIADSGNHRLQAFCPECATPLFGKAPGEVTGVTLRVGCIKQRAELMPKVQIWQRSSLDWACDVTGLPARPGQ